MSKLAATSPLPIARLQLTVRADAPLSLPPYAGSMLRGSWGHALLALAPLPHPSGQPCALHECCPYCQVFAPPALTAHRLQKFSQMPAPFVIEPPSNGAQQLAAGDTFTFGLVLIGKALQHLPTLLQAWDLALRNGLGGQRSPCTLLQICDENSLQILLDKCEPPSFLSQPGHHLMPPATPLGQQATLHLSSPLRLQYQGKPAKAHTLDARTLLVTLARRWQLLLDVHLGAQAPQQDFAQLTAQATAVQLIGHDLHWWDWGRYSQRQQQEMQLGGLLGSVQLQGNLTPFAELLHLGQWLHVGKNATMGLGGYRLTAGQSVAAATGCSTAASRVAP